jgi:hypothetical protein
MGLAIGMAVGIVSSAAAQSDPARDGREVYAAHCASCHGKTGRGDGPASLVQNRAVLDLTRLRRPDGTFDRQDVERRLRTHVMSEKMRSWGETFLTIYASREAADEVIRSLTAHLEKLQAPPGRR